MSINIYVTYYYYYYYYYYVTGRDGEKIVLL